MRYWVVTIILAIAALILGAVILPIRDPSFAVSIALWITAMIWGLTRAGAKSSGQKYVTWQALTITIMAMNGWIATALIWIAFRLGELAGALGV